MYELDGISYNDDRMFVLYLARCEARDRENGLVDWIVYHREAPNRAGWGLVTYRNSGRYPVVRVDAFSSREEAEAYMRRIEPEVPRVSLGGRSPIPAPTYDEFLRWKRDLGLKEYEYAAFFTATGINPREIITMRVGSSGSVPPAV
jgi:hypothetical protein